MTHHLTFPGWEQRERSVCRHIINAAFATHINLGGPGLLERVYERALCLELTKRKIPYRRQVYLPLKYLDETLNENHVLDLIVDERVIVEIKAFERDHPVHLAQLRTYLRQAGLTYGLLINFGKIRILEGIAYVVQRGWRGQSRGRK
ncbi:MAG: GxxExxY protein [Chlamydiia bacterium]|nr:GxxExxY protein [Chlamydiia bacterium]